MNAEAIGFAAVAVACILFGTMFAPLKRFGSADFMVVQFIMGCAIALVGLIISAIEGFPRFYPLAMLGGVVWAIGNATVVPIINILGLALGVLIWCSTELLSGWASGRFGWFGLKAEIPASSILNYLGLALSLISTVSFLFVKSVQKEHAAALHPGEIESKDAAVVELQHMAPPSVADCKDSRTGSSLKVGWLRDWKRPVGILLCLVAGVCYGVTFDPVIYMQDHADDVNGTYYGAPTTGLPYVFSYSMGIFATCTTMFVIWSAYSCGGSRRHSVDSQMFLPAFTSGIMWSIANAACFVANERLSEAVTFPFITTGPAVINALWGVLYFKEIKGRKNMIILTSAIAVTIIAGIFTGLSKTLHI